MTRSLGNRIFQLCAQLVVSNGEVQRRVARLLEGQAQAEDNEAPGTRVERFDTRATESFESLQIRIRLNSVRIQENLAELSRKFGNVKNSD